MTPRHSFAAALIIAALIPSSRAAAQQSQVPALDTSFVRHVAQMARQRSEQLTPPPATPENPRVVAQYRDALNDLERGAFTDAATTLSAILRRSPQSALYHGDLGYAYLRAGAFDLAGTEYTRAFQLQQKNGWYVLGIASTRAAQHQFADAAGAADLAQQTDSTVVDGPVASTAAGWFEAANDRARALEWARISIAKNPDNAIDWLRVASYLMARNDTTSEGPRAVRRYLALKPGDKLGSAVLANYLFVSGQDDSALTLASYAAQDSAYRAFAAQMFLQAGRTLLRRREADRALDVLARGQPWGDSIQGPQFKLFIGRAQLLKVSTLLTSFDQSHDCNLAKAADSLSAAADTNLRAGVPADTAGTRTLLESVVPQYRTNSQRAVQACSAPDARPGQRRPAARPPRKP